MLQLPKRFLGLPMPPLRVLVWLFVSVIVFAGGSCLLASRRLAVKTAEIEASVTLPSVPLAWFMKDKVELRMEAHGVASTASVHYGFFDYPKVLVPLSNGSLLLGYQYDTTFIVCVLEAEKRAVSKSRLNSELIQVIGRSSVPIREPESREIVEAKKWLGSLNSEQFKQAVCPSVWIGKIGYYPDNASLSNQLERARSYYSALEARMPR
jgi:hypothetical protein